jgi:exonuclease III
LTTLLINIATPQLADVPILIKTNKLIDVWRIYNENRQQFTWRRKDKTQASRIDMILLEITYLFKKNMFLKVLLFGA